MLFTIYGYKVRITGKFNDWNGDLFIDGLVKC